MCEAVSHPFHLQVTGADTWEAAGAEFATLCHPRPLAPLKTQDKVMLPQLFFCFVLFWSLKP